MKGENEILEELALLLLRMRKIGECCSPGANKRTEAKEE